MISSNIQVLIRFVDPDLTEEERNREVRNLLNQLARMDEVERVSRVEDPNLPNDGKPGFGFLLNLLSAEVSWKNFMVVMGFLGDRLGSKSIELELEVQGVKLKASASSRAEFEFLMKKVYEFVSTQVNHHEEGCTTDRSK